MGVQRKHNETPQNRYRLMWMEVKYEPGTLKVIAFDENGEEAAVKEIHTAGKASKIKLETDKTTLKANGEDLAFVTVSVVDKYGNPCPTANNSLSFKVKGEGKYRAACNGDATSLELFHLPKMRLFSGKLVILVASSSEAGEIELSVEGEGLKGASIQLTSTNQFEAN